MMRWGLRRSPAALAGAAACDVEAAGLRAAAPLKLGASSVLLASHDSVGARAAERCVLEGLSPGARVHHLVVVPGFWQGMTGDGWRCNGSNVRDFCDYLEGQIEREIQDHLKRVHAAASSRGLTYSASSKWGDLAPCVIAEADAGQYDLVVIGAARPKGSPGLRSRMDVGKLLRGLRVPLLVVPHPAALGSA